MDHESATRFVLALAALLAAAHAGGALARRLGAPPVAGEILAGVLLGPTLVGRLAPGLEAALFPESGQARLALEGFRLVSLALLVFMAGLEIDLDQVAKLARSAVATAAGSLVVPFGLGFALALAAPGFLEAPAAVPPRAFALLFGTVLAISALPVLARILMDVNLLATELGAITLTAAMLDDLIGWLSLSAVLAWTSSSPHVSVVVSGAGTAAFVAGLLVVVRPLVDRALGWWNARSSRPGEALAPVLVFALAGGAVTELLGTHAAIGAFVAGVAIRTEHLTEEVRRSVQRIVTSFFSPVLFAAIGLRLDYAAHFSWPLVLAVTFVACAGKLVGAGGGALLARRSRNFALACAAALNARGAMGIVISEIALEHGLIGRPLFVALVAMALVTSIASGPIMVRLVGRGVGGA